MEMNIGNCDMPDFDITLLVNVRSNVAMISLAFPFMKLNTKNKNHKGSSITVLTSSTCN